MSTSTPPGRSHARGRLAALLLTPVVAGVTLAGMSASPASATEFTAVQRAAVHAAAVKTVLDVAKSKKGTPYRYGASGPSAFDCSGFTRWVFRKVGVKLPHSSAAQVRSTKKTKKPQVGDLVFFHSRGHVYHVGIYAGHQQVWHAPSAGGEVRKQRIWTKSVWYGDVKGV